MTQSAHSPQVQALPQTSLIICSRNRPVLLTELVDSILEGQEVPTELIVVDDSDEPNEALESRTTTRACDLRYCWNRSRGLGRANNTGVSLARYDLLVFTQDDVLVHPTWFGVLVRALLDYDERTVVTGRILPGDPEVEHGYAPSTVVDDERTVYEGRLGEDVLYLQNFAIHRPVVDEIGRFDPWLGPGTPFPSAEDNDFGYRLLEAGGRIVYEPAAVTTHRAWRTREDQVTLYWNYGRGQGGFYAEHLSLRDPHILGRLLRGTGYMTARGLARVFYRPRGAAYDLIWVAGLLSGTGDWLVRRRLLPRLRGRVEDRG